MLKYIDFITETIRTDIREKVNPFLLAAKKGSSTKVKNFIKSGVDINVQDSDKKTALMYAASEGFLMVVNSLIEAGADVNLTDRKNRTALMMATTTTIIDKILSVDNVDVNIQNDKGNTKMMEELIIGYSSKTIRKYLEKFIEKGLNLDIKNNKNQNFYDLLKYKKENLNGTSNSIILNELDEVEEYIDIHFPKYKEEWNFHNNLKKFNI